MPRRESLSTGLLSAALEGLEIRKQRLDEQIAEVRRQLGGRTQKSVVVGVKPRRRLSTAARERLGAAAKRRWAQYRKQKAATAKK